MRGGARWSRSEVILSSLIILGVIALCYVFSLRFVWRPDWMTTLQDIEHDVHIKVPANAHNLYGYAEGFQDTTTYIRFDIDPIDLPILLANTQDLPRLLPAKFPGVSDDFLRYHPWWQPLVAWQPAIDHLFIARGGRFGSREKYILVEMTDPQTYRVYIYYYHP
jgi:hypothetical protein